MKIYFKIAFIALFLVSCGTTPTPSVPHTTPTLTALPTNTPEPTKTLEPTPTITPTPDLRVVDGVPLDFQINNLDLPSESKFYLPNSEWTGRGSNTEVIGGWGVDEGREYLERTRRVDGWWTYLARGSDNLTAPEVVSCNVVQYETAEGAKIALTEYSVFNPLRVKEIKYTLANEEFPDLGEISMAYFRDIMQDSGVMYREYSIVATYYNYVINCDGVGRKVEVRPEYVADLVNIVINKMKAAGLVNP